ncbi:MAG TPA: alpha/beta fold hydrolase [Candidatus Krumholzibacteria bacterium]|nr:alpha/beta fold hydrolase [Candidatus Krumholzibacteria bacterium]
MTRLLAALLLLAVAAPATAQTPEPLDCNRDAIHFTSGDFHLAGDLLMPRTKGDHPVIIYVWGAGPSNRQRHIDTSPVLRTFLDKGFAVLLYDKPGSGESTGQIDNRHQFDQLASILIDAIGVLRKHKNIDRHAIGLYGSSQASYVMAVALSRTEDVAFVIAWSCPMQNSIDQSAFLVRNYVLCDGGSPDLAAEAEDAYQRRGRATSYTEYHAAAAFLDSIPAIRDGLGWAGVAPDSDFTPADTTSESFLDPSATFAALKIPILALYAENDRQIDAVHGAQACRRFFAAAGQPLSSVAIVPGADHNMNLSPRGCMQDQRDNYSAVGGKTASPVFLATIAQWLDVLKPELR